MYAPDTTQLQVDTASKALRFKLRYHTADEISYNNQILNDLYDRETGKLRRPLSPDERRYIQNEQNLCKWDYLYWLEHYHYIINWEKEVVTMKPNIAQQIILDCKAEMERKRLPIMLINLKARQLGITTEGIADVGHRVQFHKNVMAIVGSSTPYKSEEMYQKMIFSWDRQPWWLVPQILVDRRGESALRRFADVDSTLSVQHGAKVNADVGRGQTPSVAMLSEVSEWLNPYNDIDAALRNAMHEHEGMMLQLESTARGMSGYWSDAWKDATEHFNDPLEPSDLYPVFLPWYVGTDIYPTAVWLRRNPIPSNWTPTPYVLRHADRAQKYVSNNTLLRRYMGSNWKLPREQQWWYEVNYNIAKRKDQLNMFLQECPADELEAFQTQGHSIFDAEIIASYHNATTEPKAIFMLDGPSDEIRPELKPDARWVDPNKRPIPIDGKYSLVPMRLNGWPDKNPDARIYLWSLPTPDIEYGFGVDTAQGIGLDSTNIEGIKKADFKNVAAQICEFNSNRINAVDVIPYLHVLGRLYTVAVKGQRRQPRMVIETQAGGDTTQLGMRKLGWNNFHAWLRYDRVNIDQSKVHVLGTVTTQWSRDMILSWLIASLRDLQFDIYSPWFVQEMRTLCKDENRQKIAGEFNSHDDRIMSMAWVYLSMHILESGEFRSPFGRSRISMEQSPVDEPKYPKYRAPSSMTPTRAPDYDIAPPPDELVAALSWKAPVTYPTQPPSPLWRPPEWRP